MKQCKEYEDLIPLYVTGDLDAESQVEVEMHLHGCEACRQYQLSLSSIITTMNQDRIRIPKSYGAELVVTLNHRLEKRQARQKQLLWAIPAFTSTFAILLITVFSLFNSETSSNQWLAQLNQDHSYINFSNVGYFGEMLMEDDIDSAAETNLSTDEIFKNAVYQIIEEKSLSEIDRYLAATIQLNEAEFQNIINEMKYEI
ncbi:MAG: zf-HC2 domain-containing protein, partial [Candidatus Marinimicrobia bacterium]|nr:zf-HC2 domain-containing protein [Candidatus Neomarinimicrobiota bacterium]